ncbi:hypothetical protein Nepgr_020097 [Nepenthes gracilis]|uniref:Secreted protein n=1 Tax=Nepenthes gracilis TaxID=150966 RepID=A0AAD3XW13_NEPGR|nr:hypothetical protein Nepgr_020097 [Nepenthes gracilis]
MMILMLVLFCGVIIAIAQEVRFTKPNPNDTWYGLPLPPQPRPGYYKYLGDCIDKTTQSCGIQIIDAIFEGSHVQATPLDPKTCLKVPAEDSEGDACILKSAVASGRMACLYREVCVGVNSGGFLHQIFVEKWQLHHFARVNRPTNATYFVIIFSGGITESSSGHYDKNQGPSEAFATRDKKLLLPRKEKIDSVRDSASID